MYQERDTWQLRHIGIDLPGGLMRNVSSRVTPRAVLDFVEGTALTKHSLRRAKDGK